MLGTAKRGSVCFGNQKNSVGWSHFSHNLNMLVMLTTSSMIRLWCMCFVASTLRGSVYFGSETKFIISHFPPPSTFSQSLIMLLTLTTSSTISLWCIYLRGSVYFGHQNKIRIKCFFFFPQRFFPNLHHASWGFGDCVHLKLSCLHDFESSAPTKCCVCNVTYTLNFFHLNFKCPCRACLKEEKKEKKKD